MRSMLLKRLPNIKQVSPKAKRLSANEHDELTTLMIQKDSELKETMKLASEQGELDKKMKLLQDEVQKQGY